GITEENRIDGGELSAPVNLIGKISAELQLQILEAIERCFGESVAFQIPFRLSFKLRGFAEKHIKSIAGCIFQEFVAMTKFDPRFFHVDGLICADRIPIVQINEVDAYSSRNSCRGLYIQNERCNADFKRGAGRNG